MTPAEARPRSLTTRARDGTSKQSACGPSEHRYIHHTIVGVHSKQCPCRSGAEGPLWGTRAPRTVGHRPARGKRSDGLHKTPSKQRGSRQDTRHKPRAARVRAQPRNGPLPPSKPSELSQASGHHGHTGAPLLHEQQWLEGARASGMLALPCSRDPHHPSKGFFRYLIVSRGDIRWSPQRPGG